MGMRAVVYTRISQDREGTEQGIARQREDCLALAEKVGARVIEVVEDNDVSAFSRKVRPGWSRVIDMVQAGEIDMIIAWHVDRMYRQLTDLLDLAKIADARSLTVMTVMSGKVDFSSADNWLSGVFLAGIAEHESRHKSERIARAHRQLAEQGKAKGGRRPWGYYPDQVEVYEREAQPIREAVEMILSGHSIRAAADHVGARLLATAAEEERNQLADVTHRKLPDIRTSISRTSMRDVVLSPRIAGLRQHFPQREREQFREQQRRSEVRGGFPFDTVKTYPAVWQGLVSEDAWHEVKAILLDPERIGGKKRPRKSMLAGLLRCGKCILKSDEDGDPVVSNLGYGPKAYTCPRCGGVGINPAPVEKLIVRKIGERIARSPQDFPEEPGVDPRAELFTRAEAADQARRVLVANLLRHPSAADALHEGLAKIEAELASITEERRKVDLAILERRRAHALFPTWEAADAIGKGEIIRLVANYFVVEPIDRTGRAFQPGRVLVNWVDEPGVLYRLGPTPVTLAQKRELQREKALYARDYFRNGTRRLTRG